jgi:hypothetical protein
LDNRQEIDDVFVWENKDKRSMRVEAKTCFIWRIEIMKREEIKINLEAIYLDYYDGLYNEIQLKHMLKKLYIKANVDISEWSEMILDAQWRHATEEDYENKRRELEEEEKEG